MSSRPNIDEILNSIEGIKRAEPKSFFTGRVLSRINSLAQSENLVLTPRFRMGVIAVILLVAINILLYIYKYQLEPMQALAEWKSTTPEWVVDYTDNPGSSLPQAPTK
jgi:hypothetical protein